MGSTRRLNTIVLRSPARTIWDKPWSELPCQMRSFDMFYSARMTRWVMAIRLRPSCLLATTFQTQILPESLPVNIVFSSGEALDLTVSRQLEPGLRFDSKIRMLRLLGHR